MTAPSWERQLVFAVSLHRLALLAGYRLVGDAAAVESARLEVVALLDATLADGVPERELDRALERIAAEREQHLPETTKAPPSPRGLRLRSMRPQPHEGGAGEA